MGTITTRQCKSGALRHTAQIRLKRNGRVVHSEARTFGTTTRAKEWLRNREFEVRQQLAGRSARQTRTRLKTVDGSKNGRSAQPHGIDPTTSQTLALLLIEFGSGQILLEKSCHYFGLNPAEAKRAAIRQSLPIPVFRLGSQKSPWMISAFHLAHHIEATSARSESDWRRLRSESNPRR